jgi:hypothetical protein
MMHVLWSGFFFQLFWYKQFCNFFLQIGQISQNFTLRKSQFFIKIWNLVFKKEIERDQFDGLGKLILHRNFGAFNCHKEHLHDIPFPSTIKMNQSVKLIHVYDTKVKGILLSKYPTVVMLWVKQLSIVCLLHNCLLLQRISTTFLCFQTWKAFFKDWWDFMCFLKLWIQTRRAIVIPFPMVGLMGFQVFY